LDRCDLHLGDSRLQYDHEAQPCQNRCDLHLGDSRLQLQPMQITTKAEIW
jgi:hypothetical protein